MGGVNNVPLDIHPLIRSFVHSFVHSFIQPSKRRAQPSKSMRVYRRGKFRAHSRGSAPPIDITPPPKTRRNPKTSAQTLFDTLVGDFRGHSSQKLPVLYLYCKSCQFYSSQKLLAAQHLYYQVVSSEATAIRSYICTTKCAVLRPHLPEAPSRSRLHYQVASSEASATLGRSCETLSEDTCGKLL